jgi:cation diffusion facilitator CzcD-associated flavoprotein CzcO
MPQLPTVAVIGAGSSGIAALKALAEHGFEVTCFEASDRVGGNWVFGNKNGMSAAYRHLHINTSRDRMAYSDFPMPRDYPDYPRHDQIARYFDAYVDHFAVRDRIRFETVVARARRLDGAGWELELGDGARERFDALVVANGHHWDKRWPEPPIPGAEGFAGEQLHAHDYVDNDPLRDRDVVVLGIGNSAVDIAVESSYVARSTHLASRRGAWIVPKYLFGRPTDQLRNDPRVPFAVRRRLFGGLIRLHAGRPEQYGLQKPDHRFGEAHPTVSGRLLDRVQHGTITPKPNLVRLHAREAEFADGTRAPADVVVYCTGYKITFPFFDEELVSAPGNRIELFRRVFHPDLDDVFFIGLLQPLGAIMPLAEAQGAWVAEHLRGAYHLPAREELLEGMRRDFGAMRRRYVASKRHTIQVDFDDYLLALARERRRGAGRARAAGFALPVPRRSAGRPAVPA